MSIVWKLLRQHISAVQLCGFALANMVGLMIVILSIQFYNDVLPIFNDEDSFIKKDYLVISKHVTAIGTLRGKAERFSEKDIDKLKRQPWVRDVGAFTASDYNISASVAISATQGMSTSLFFEAVPDKYIDVQDAQWSFDPNNPEVPIILSKDYLSLYNFGFASTKGLPQVSEGVIGMIPLTLTISSHGVTHTLKGKIVGFSNRLNTILVPQTFIEWSNNQYGSETKKEPSRLIVEVNNPGDADIATYIKSHNYDIAGDKLESGKANYFLTIIVGIVVAIGVLISLLSFFVLMLSIYLLLQKNTQTLEDMLMLGYSPAQVARPYQIMVISINMAVLLISVLIMFIIRMAYLPQLSIFGVSGASLAWSIGTGTILMAAISIINIIAIYRKISLLWWRK